jgi:uroporphyrinogen-III decarboxylase
MTMITPRERVMRTLLGQPVDRPPFGFGIGFGPWGETVERWKRESGIPDLDVSRHFGYEPAFHWVAINQGPWPPFEREVLAEDAHTITVRDSRGIVRRDMKDNPSMPEFLDYPVHNRREWEQFKAERLQPDAQGRFIKPGCRRNLWNEEPWEGASAEEFARHQARRAEEAGVAVALGEFPWGVFGTARDILGVEELLVSFYTQPELVHDIMDTLTNLWIYLYGQVAPFMKVDLIHIWEDMSGKQGSLISPAMIEEFMMPNYRKIRAFAEARGIPLISVDSDGLVDELIPVMMASGMNVMFPFEVQAGCDIERYRRQYPTLAMIGGLNKYALAQGRTAIDREIDKAARMLKHGRYIPGLDHLIPFDVPWEAYVYYIRRLKDIMGMA